VTPVDQSQVALRLVRREERFDGADRSPGTSGWLDEVYRRYCRYVGAVVLRLDGRGQEVDDLVQDVFVEAARGIGRLREPGAIKGWLATIAVRLVRRRLRVRRVRQLLGLGDHHADYASLVDPAASPVDKLVVRAVYEVLDRMAVADRLAFSLHHIQGEGIDAVARMCGCSAATAKRRIARAQAAIQARLEAE
jgi:RNA polymerase sigma-70 factor (ECF subfamily)